uniref:Rho GTPase activating protein 21b n=1 Tax=Gadus morhua TaxID=8049 RepID=A0A8C5AQ53_GADMO
MAQATDAPPPSGQACRGSVATSDLGYRKEITVPPSPPRAPYPKSQLAVSLRNDGLRTVVVPPDAAPAGRMGPSHRMDYADPAFLRARPRSVSQYPAPRKADVYPGGPGLAPYGLLPPPHFPNNHQNIDWRTYQTYREYIDNKGIHTHASRTIQERLDSLRAGGHNSFGTAQHVPPAGWVPKGVRRRSTSHERSYHGPPPRFQVPPRSASQDRMCGAERAAQARHWPPRSVSQDGLALKARSRSTDYVEAAEPAWPAERRGGGGGGGGGYGRPDQGARPSRQALPRQASLYRPSAAYGTGNMRGPPNPAHYAQGPEALQTRSSPMLAERSSHPGPSGPLADQRAKANLAGHLPQQGRSRAETLHAAAAGSGREATALGYRPSSYSAPQQRPQRPSILKTGPPLPPPPHHLPQSHMNGGRSPAEGGVVLREKPPCGKTPSPLRHPSYILAVNDDGDPAAGVAACWLPNDTRREIHMRRLDEQRQASCSSNLDESLDAIPFIDEPASPSVDREVTSIPAAAVISVAPAQVNAPPSPATPSPLIRRQLSHDQGKSCFGDRWPISSSASWNYVGVLMGCVSPVLRGFVRDVASSRLCLHLQTLDGHKSDDSSSRRDSSSDIFPDSSKEGWLNLRQLLTDKSKRVGGGMKSWKQTYGVLRGHSLTLYKDKKEGLSHASSQSDEDLQPICVKACLIDISYSDTKRKNVLRLTTSDCEYLFQAEGRDDMLSWIRVIQESSNLDQENTSFTSQDLISRKIKEYNTMMSRSEPSPKASRQSLSLKQAFLGPKGEGKGHSPHSPKTGDDRRSARDDSSPPRDRASWKMGIPGLMRKPFEKKPPAGASFGVRLDDCPPAISNRFVPLIVEVCCKVVEERGLEYTGIYRVPGNNAAISNMQEELNSKGMNDIDVEEDKWRDLNVISSLLKSFFRKLPEPLFTNEKYADFIEANRAEEAVERLKELKRLIYELPEHHYETLKYLLLHLKKVAENCETNKMEPRNLAIVFGPTLVRTSEDNMTNMVNHMPDQCKIVENLIQQCDWFFSQEATDEPDTSADQESTVQSQPVPNIDHLLSNIGRTAASPGEVSGQVGGVYHSLMSLLDSVMSAVDSWDCRKKDECCAQCSCLICRSPRRLL